ncbi:AAA family ATPase [Stutzerimonas nitrititolerans]|uniref:AAA family ATPase n=1 Tax=Stutzerimonas nitrititolerans TaxID=2482751 RepID=UPI0028A879E8|nr:AAA family ATPase [Stutzerimonas nitrititolerans]
MKGLVKKIDTIKNIAVFKDFKWATSMRDDENNIAEFKKINIIFGRNYSGKTTLSRVFQALETGVISDKYTAPEFSLSFVDEKGASQNDLKSHGQTVRVFNEDFIKQNLQFISDDTQSIAPFAILGEDNGKLETEIAELQGKLGDEKDKNSLTGTLQEKEQDFNTAKSQHEDKEAALESKLKDKANKAGTGIKHNKIFGDANYNTTKIKADIETVSEDTFEAISREEAEDLHKLLKEETKQSIPEQPPTKLLYESLEKTTKTILSKEISASEPLQALLNDVALEMWVRNGKELHKDKRTHCSFCGNIIPADLWEKLDKHFNKASEELREEIDKLLTSIGREKEKIGNIIIIQPSNFYSKFHRQLDELEIKLKEREKTYTEALDNLSLQLRARKDNIYKTIEIVKKESHQKDIEDIQSQYAELVVASNDFSESLSTKQTAAKKSLRLHEVSSFLTDIAYTQEKQEISALETASNQAKEAVEEIKKEIFEINTKILNLQAQLKDESKGADKVNSYLNNFFGHQSLSLEAIEDASISGNKSYRFEVTRDKKKAFHLSEGECSLIAFCYFMAKLDDYETRGKQPIIWIDDPISSLDSNHIFFIYSLIYAEIVTPETYEENGTEKQRERFKQLFISTHNLDFLKYLKRLPGALNKQNSQYITIHRQDKTSSLSLMPRHLKEYVTEFNYLFNQIHTCATIEQVTDENYTAFYNFGNNARKFFETYLYYKYPNKGMSDETLLLFFGRDKVPAVLTDRINNEYSHLCGVFERGSTPVEVPEMKKSAMVILERLREHDADQYQSLLESIGAS